MRRKMKIENCQSWDEKMKHVREHHHIWRHKLEDIRLHQSDREFQLPTMRRSKSTCLKKERYLHTKKSESSVLMKDEGWRVRGWRVTGEGTAHLNSITNFGFIEVSVSVDPLVCHKYIWDWRNLTSLNMKVRSWKVKSEGWKEHMLSPDQQCHTISNLKTKQSAKILKKTTLKLQQQNESLVCCD